MADTFNSIRVKGAGTAGTADAGVVTVQGIASGTTIPVTAAQATASNLNAQVQGTSASGASKSGNPVQVGGVFNTTQPTVTTGQTVEAQATARGALIVATGTDAFNVALAANQSVNVAQVNGITVLTGTGATGTGSQRVTVAVDSATVAGSATLPAGTNIIGKVGIDQTTPGTTNRVAANIDQVSGATQSATNPLFTQITDGVTAISQTNPLPVTIQARAGTGVFSGALTSASLAAGASVNLTGADITTAKTGKLLQYSASSSVPCKVEVQTFDGTTATTKLVKFFNSMSSVGETFADDDFITQAGGTGKAFRVKITNLDNLNAADVYSSFGWSEI